MPLFWISYPLIFFLLIFMMKMVYSIYLLEDLDMIVKKYKLKKNLWFW